MRNQDKAFLRWLIINKPQLSDKAMADDAECTVQTVRRYRKALAARKEQPNG